MQHQTEIHNDVQSSFSNKNTFLYSKTGIGKTIGKKVKNASPICQQTFFQFSNSKYHDIWLAENKNIQIELMTQIGILRKGGDTGL